ncbi:hypothetical protein EUTSA_v10011879mg [Eutrema salsugineum]|uniref:Uncharacterized protein n=1 Tax=Eutrema salsugineum TaxID=72664 RepID=V4JXL7_EUTSA|nr:hypothetical protein EUTSA_v10011879mg [Eutrema salsugineum]
MNRYLEEEKPLSHIFGSSYCMDNFLFEAFCSTPRLLLHDVPTISTSVAFYEWMERNEKNCLVCGKVMKFNESHSALSSNQFQFLRLLTIPSLLFLRPLLKLFCLCSWSHFPLN